MGRKVARYAPPSGSMPSARGRRRRRFVEIPMAVAYFSHPLVRWGDYLDGTQARPVGLGGITTAKLAMGWNP